MTRFERISRPIRSGCARNRAWIQLLSHAQVDQVIARFEPLNPYDQAIMPGSVLELEKETGTPRTSRDLELRARADARGARP